MASDEIHVVRKRPSRSPSTPLQRRLSPKAPILAPPIQARSSARTMSAPFREGIKTLPRQLPSNCQPSSMIKRLLYSISLCRLYRFEFVQNSWFRCQPSTVLQMREFRIGRFRKEIRTFARLETAEGIELKHFEEIRDKRYRPYTQ
jgi:hypothetical protein